MKNLMKTSVQTIKSLMFVVIICLTSNIVTAQIIVLEFMKVEPSMLSTYLEVEEAWSKLHKKSVDSGYLLTWSLNEKMFHGTEDEYDFVTVNVYADWATYEKGLPDGYYDQLGEDILTKTGESRKLVRSEVYAMVVDAENSKPSKFSNLVFMKVEQGNSSAYVNMEKKYYKVYHKALIEAGGMNSWGIYQRIVPFGFGNEYNYVAVNGFESLSQQANVSEEAYDAAWKKAAAGTPDDDINKLTNESRVMVTSEMWRNVMSVTASE